jgi:5-methylcytosine-specific restriction endonuclease McrA
MTPPPKRGRGGKRRRRPAVQEDQLASSSTSMRAYMETRRWLLATHGPVCAYCGVKGVAGEMTLDHLTPRRGQSAYDRRDNLVLCCKRCNQAKADKPFLAYLLAQPRRAVTLLKYGAHLSDEILHHVRHLAGNRLAAEPAQPARPPREVFGRDPDEESPYADEPQPTAKRPAARRSRRKRH